MTDQARCPVNRVRALMLTCILLALGSGAEAANRLKVRAIALTNGQAVLDVNGHPRKLLVGQTSPEGIALKSASVAEAIIEIDGRTQTLKLDGHISDAFSRGEAAKIVRLMPGSGGHYYADGQVNGGAVHFIVDTGATRVVLNKHMARQIGVQYRVDGRPGRVETASGVTAAYYLTFDRVQIQSLGLTNVDGIVVDGDYPSVALLGQSFLNRLDMQRKGNLLELRER